MNDKNTLIQFAIIYLILICYLLDVMSFETTIVYYTMFVLIEIKTLQKVKNDN